MWTDGPRCCCCFFFSSLLTLDLPNPFEWLSSKQHGHLTTARGMTITQRHIGGTSCPSVTHYNPFPQFLCYGPFFHWFCYELWNWSGRCPSNPPRKPVNQTRGETSDPHMRACVRNTAQWWHFRNSLNNWKSEKTKKKNLPQNEPGHDLQKEYILRN